jgi:hypothetical protein
MSDIIPKSHHKPLDYPKLTRSRPDAPEDMSPNEVILFEKTCDAMEDAGTISAHFIGQMSARVKLMSRLKELEKAIEAKGGAIAYMETFNLRSGGINLIVEEQKTQRQLAATDKELGLTPKSAKRSAISKIVINEAPKMAAFTDKLRNVN